METTADDYPGYSAILRTMGPLIEIKEDAFGLGTAGKPLTQVIALGLWGIWGPWVQRRKTSAAIESAQAISQALEQNPSLAQSLPPQVIARIVNEESHRQENREAIAHSAIEEFKVNQSNTPSPQIIEREWADRFWRLAQEVNNEDMQSLWGRILARHASGTQNYSARCLEALSMLSGEEARLLERIATFTCFIPQTGQRAIVIKLGGGVSALIEGEYIEKIREIIGDFQGATLSSAGLLLFVSNGINHGVTIPLTEGKGEVVIANKSMAINCHPTFNAFQIGSGYFFTPVGNEIMSLIHAEANSAYISTLEEFFKKRTSSN